MEERVAVKLIHQEFKSYHYKKEPVKGAFDNEKWFKKVQENNESRLKRKVASVIYIHK